LVTCDIRPRDGNTTGFPAARSEVSMSEVSQDVTQLLRAWGDGNREALEQLTPLVYAELHKSAKRYMARENPGHTLQATALINEVYLRLVDINQITWQNRAHFFGVCANIMRRILTDFARSRHYLKRGGQVARITLDEAVLPSSSRAPDLLALDASLNRLAQVDPRKAQVVELRFFAGLSVQETAAVLGVSVETVMRDWAFAKIWLLRQLNEGIPRDS
jgi:RNA polymerase sigma-70 factor, ECF subfamily